MTKSPSNTPVVLVIGEEMLNQAVANDMIAALDVLSPCDVCIFGQSGRLLDKKMPNLIQFVEKANHCIIKVANCEDALSTLGGTINDIAVDLYTRPFTVKQKLFIAEKNNTLRARLKEVRYLVFPREGNPGEGNQRDGVAAAVMRPTLPDSCAS